ncbi:hypothetical protein ANAPC5_01319 [Anaplasma phagocytophilum]|nr:hypothetical protein ANAPC5_01319 [Anaplasma phagocytophilum]
MVLQNDMNDMVRRAVTNIQFFSHFIDGDTPVPVHEPFHSRDCVRRL